VHVEPLDLQAIVRRGEQGPFQRLGAIGDNRVTVCQIDPHTSFGRGCHGSYGWNPVP